MKYVTALAALAASPALAQNECPDCMVIADLKRTDIVVVGTRAEQLPEQNGQAITVLERDDFERLQSQSVADILATTPGVTATRNGGLGAFSAVRIRGAEGEQTLTLIDGVRVNDPSSPGSGFDFGTLLVGNIERIEGLSGPNSVPWGSQAIGGVVNIVTARAPDDFGGAVRGGLALVLGRHKSSPSLSRGGGPPA